MRSREFPSSSGADRLKRPSQSLFSSNICEGLELPLDYSGRMSECPAGQAAGAARYTHSPSRAMVV